MLNEFKKQMWNDGPAKQPWLNYFNEYERTHCCFGDDGSDVGDADDISFNTSSKAARDASTEQSSGMSADQAQAVSDAIDEAQKAGASVTEMQSIAEGGNRAAEAGYTGQDLQTVAAANIDTDFFSPDNTYGVGSGFTSGIGSFADPFSDSGVGQTSFGSYVSDLGKAAKGLASVSSIGVLSDLISNIAKEKGKPESEVTQEEINAVISDRPKGPEEYTMTGRPKGPEEYTMEGRPKGPEEYTMTGRPLGPEEYTMEGRPLGPEEYTMTGRPLGPEEYTMTGRPLGPEEYTMTGRPLGPEEYTMSPGPASPGYGGAALDVGFMTDEALREGYTQEARDFANLDYTPTIGPFEEIEGDEPIILPKKKEEEEEPKSAMAQYFERLGVPSPYAPSTTQSASPYLSAVAAQPAGAPEDLFARMARIRRREALKTPKFNYAGFAPFSPNLYAAAYGISPEEARERIPALPTLKQTIGFPDDDEDETTEAYGGGGLNTLMRTR